MDLRDSIWIDGAEDFEIELDVRFSKLAYEIIAGYQYGDKSAEDVLTRLVSLKEDTAFKWFSKKYEIVEAN